MDLSYILFAIVVGLIAGFAARALLPGKDDMGIVPTLVLGLAGSFIGSLFFVKVLGIGDEDKFDFGGIIGAILGAMVLLAIYNAVTGKKKGGDIATTPRV